MNRKAIAWLVIFAILVVIVDLFTWFVGYLRDFTDFLVVTALGAATVLAFTHQRSKQRQHHRRRSWSDQWKYNDQPIIYFCRGRYWQAHRRLSSSPRARACQVLHSTCPPIANRPPRPPARP